MSRIRPHTISRRYFPHFDGLVPTARNDKVSCRHECDTGNVVIMAQHSTDAFEALLKIPELDAHV